MSKDKLTLEKSAKETVANNKDIPSVNPRPTPEKPWEEVKDDFTPNPDMIVFRVPEKTESGIILPEGAKLIDEDEYRPVVELVGEDVSFVSPGDHMVLHSQANQAAIPMKFKGHPVYLVHQQFVVGKSTS